MQALAAAASSVVEEETQRMAQCHRGCLARVGSQSTRQKSWLHIRGIGT